MKSRINDLNSPLGHSQQGVRVWVQGLVKEYEPGVRALQGVDLYARASELVAIVGPNGAGKSTTLNILATLIRPSSGQVEICNKPVSRARLVRSKLGVALQEAGLDPMMTALEHFEVQGALCGMSRVESKGRGEELLEELDLDMRSSKPVGLFSGGMQRRLALGLALLNDPPVVLLDEPTAGLDPYSRRRVWAFLRRLKDSGKTIIMSTHYLEEAEKLCDRIYLLFGGQIVRSGTPDSIHEQGTAQRRRITVDACVDPEDMNELLLEIGLQGGSTIRPSGIDGVTVEVSTDAEGAELVGRLLLELNSRSAEVREVHFDLPSLEEVYLSLEELEPEDETSARSGIETAARRVRGGRRWH